MSLSGRQKRALRALGHGLKPVLTIGKQGIAETVIQQLEDNLLAQELVKVKILKSCPQTMSGIAETLSGRTGAELAQSIGRSLLFYRPHPENPAIKLPP